MSVVSFTTKLKNDMEDIERESDKYIDPSHYYIVRIFPQDYSFPEKIKSMAKTLLTRNSMHLPLTVYFFDKDVYAVFSCTDGAQHYLNGSHHAILSEYVSFASSFLEHSFVNCSIVQFLSQTQIVSYFTWKVYTYSKKYIEELLQKDSEETLMELIAELRKTKNIEWDHIPSENRYGIFYKLKKQNDRFILSTLSEYLDASKYPKYIQYIFGVSS